MKFLLDAQFAPRLAQLISDGNEDLEAVSVRDVGLLHANDGEIFDYACRHGYVVMSKDQDFVDLVTRRGAPPQVVWFTCGNLSTTATWARLRSTLPAAIEQLADGEPCVEMA